MANGVIKTYNPKQIVASWGSHIIDGFADDSFITIEASGEGITKKVGCDGEIVRSISPDNTFKVKFALLQTSSSNAFFNQMANLDRETGEGMFPLTIKDLKGSLLFSTEAAWVIKKPSLTRGKADNNREWELDTGDATLDE